MATDSNLGLTKHQIEFVKLIKLNAYSHRLHEVFRDFCEIAAISISNAVDKAQYEAREERYMQVIKGYTTEEINRFPQMLVCVVNSLELNFSDCLGELFMHLELGTHWHGQFFTPYHICKLMASLTSGNEEEIIAERGYFTVMEPAAGAGAMLIAKAEDLREKEINYQKVMHATAVDIDITAVHMAYIQLSLLFIPGVVFHGNTLSNETWDYWVTPAHVLGLWDFKFGCETKESNPENYKIPKNSPPLPDLAKWQLKNVINERVKFEQICLF